MGVGVEREITYRSGLCTRDQRVDEPRVLWLDFDSLLTAKVTLISSSIDQLFEAV